MLEDEERYSDTTEQSDETKLLESMATLKKELSEARQEAADCLTNRQREKADFTNFRRRLEQDKAEAIKYAEGDLILQLILILDDLDRAMKHIPHEFKSDGWAQGIEGIARKFKGMLEAVGLKEIDAIGCTFDPTIHEAVACLSGPEDSVIAEHAKGYYFKDRVLRPSRVAVGSGNEGGDVAT